MDTNAMMPAVKTKEKRERQPNWTEAEKQLLLSLTRMHQVILENKGSDTMTIKRKSEAWDDIASNMRAAGYQRSKERLKQQLGRIRAAEAKKAKDALAKEFTTPVIAVLSCSNQSNSMGDSLLCESTLAEKHSTSNAAANVTTEKPNELNMPSPLVEEIEIKVEKVTSVDESETASCKDPMTERQMPSFSTPLATMAINDAKKRRCCPQPYLSEHFFDGSSAGDVTNELEHQLPSTSSNSKDHNMYKQRKRRCRIRLNGHVLRSKVQVMRQLHLYRIAVEKERLKTLRLQQCRDRVLYRKDKQIQNLKLQILRNIANRNQNNHINL